MTTSTVQLPARWRLIAAITRKELVTILNHPYHRISLLIPLLMSLVFLLLTSPLDNIDTIELVLYDQGASALPVALEALTDISVAKVDSETAVFDALKEQATVGFIIPEGFDTAVANGRSPEITVYLNSEARSSSVATAQRLLVETIATLRNPAPAAQITWTEQPTSGLNLAEFSLENYIFTTLVLLSMGIMTCSLLPHLLQEEQEQGAYQSLMATPASPIDSLVSKMIACLLLVWIIIGFVALIHNGGQGNWLITAVAILLCSFFMAGIGLLLGFVVQKKSQVKAVASVMILLLSMPSWFAFTSLETLPNPAELLIRIIPTHYFVTTLAHALANQPWSAVTTSLTILGVSTAVIYLLVGWQLSRNRSLFL